MIMLLFGFSLSVTRYNSNNGVKYLKDKHPNAAKVEFIGDGHNTSYFVVVDSNYQVTGYISYNNFGSPKIEKIEK
jgi:hypothetical protein